MEINRRTFVTGMTFAGGAAMGLMLSPAPWYLLRDAAFWTQNWPWVPTPKAGETSFEHGVCRVCGAGCGITLRKVDERPVRVDGNRNHPVSGGAICPLGTASLQMFYSPARIKTPLRRTGARGASSWQPVTWETAVDEMSGRIALLRSSEKSHALACITGNENTTTNQLFGRLLDAVGSPNFIKMNTGEDARNMVHRIMQGTDAVAVDIENARCILSFGCSLFEGWGGLGRMYRWKSVWAARPEDDRPEIIQVEPNLSITASQASRWVPLNPGTEAALALGIAHVMIRDGLHDRAFAEKHCFGFKDWQDAVGKTHPGFESEVLARYSPQLVESITSVPAREIKDLAYLFASSQPALALCGGGRGDRFRNLYALMAVNSLNALVGNINRPGGVLTQSPPPLKPLPPVKKDAESERGLSMPRCDGALSAQYPLTESLPHNIDARQIEVLLVHEANPYYTLPDEQAARDLFDNIPYIVSFSSCMDETAARADLILPLSAPIERWDDLIGVPGLPYAVYNLNRPLVSPPYDTRCAGDIVIQTARRLGGAVGESFPWDSTAEVLKERAEGLYEADRGMINLPAADTPAGQKAAHLQGRYPSFSAFWADLFENGCWYDPVLEYGKARETHAPGGNVEFYSRKLQKHFQFSNDVKCMPHYVEPEPAPEGFDLIVMPEDLVAMPSDGQETPPMLIKQLSNTVLRGDELYVRIHPVTAMYQGLKDGDTIIVESTRGKVRVRVHISAGMREGVVVIPLGFGHTACDRFLRNKGVNAYRLIEFRADPLSGLLCCCETPARIRKA